MARGVRWLEWIVLRRQTVHSSAGVAGEQKDDMLLLLLLLLRGLIVMCGV
jgi:hypothetical protein